MDPWLSLVLSLILPYPFFTLLCSYWPSIPPSYFLHLWVSLPGMFFIQIFTGLAHSHHSSSKSVFLDHICKENSIFLLPPEISLFYCHASCTFYFYLPSFFGVLPLEFIQLNKSNPYYMPGTILGAENTTVKKS